MSGSAVLLAYCAIVGLVFWGILGFPLPNKNKGSARTSSSRPFPGSDKPFPHARPPDRSSPNPFHAAPLSFNPLERDVPVLLEDRFVYREDEEGLHRFDERAEWEEEIRENEQATHSGLSSILIAFPKYDYSMDYREYKKWKDFCVQLGHIIPYRIFKEFDEDSNMAKNN